MPRTGLNSDGVADSEEVKRLEATNHMGKGERGIAGKHEGTIGGLRP